MPSPLRILHLTDLHFSSGGVPEVIDDKLGNRIIRERAGDDLAKRFLANLKVHLGKSAEDDWPKVVVVTGDLVNKGGKDANANGVGEFDRAAQFLTQVQQTLRIEPDRVLVVPGNHDVDWSPDLTLEERFRPFMNAMASFSTPKVTRDGPEPVWVDLSTIRQGIDVEVLLLVSPTFSGAPDEDRRSLLSHVKQRLAGERLQVKWDEIEEPRLLDIALIGSHQRNKILSRAPKDNLRIALLHHHVLPDDQIELSPFEAVLDSGRLLEVLVSRGFDLILSGHKHKRRLVQYRARNPDGDPDGVIDVYSGPSLFHSHPGGATMINIYGDDHPYYLELVQLESHQQLTPAYTKRLVRDKRILPHVLTECAHISTVDQERYVIPLVQSLAHGIARMKAGPTATADLFRSILEKQIATELLEFGRGHLELRPPKLFQRWTDLIAIAGAAGGGLRLVSQNDLAYWEKAKDPLSTTARYEKPISTFKGRKERRILIPRSSLLDPDVKRRWDVVVKRMLGYDLRICIIDPDKVVKDSVRDFGIIGNLAVSQFDTLEGVARSLREWFDAEAIATFSQHWENLAEGTYWDSDGGRSLADATD
ncbi:MAG: metallophosphoesterase [Planctomycetota bacterium]